MPRRSNIFQRLVAAIHQQLGHGWSVAESRDLLDKRTGQPREVDVVAEATVGGYTLLLCVEVRDHKRRADVTWVDSMAQKHADLGTSKLVLWSATDFSRAAVAKAAALGIGTVTPATIDDAPWAVLARQLIGSSVKFVRPRFDPVVDVRLADGTLVRWAAPPSLVLKQVGGDKEARVASILSQIRQTPDLRTTLLDHAPEGSGSFHVVYTPPFTCEVRGPAGEIGELTRLLISIATVTETANVAVRSAVRDGVATTLAEATLAAGTLQFVVREPSAGPTSTTVTLVPSAGEPSA